MSDEADQLYFEARKLIDPDARSAFLEKACKGEPDLRRHIERLLADEAGADSFFTEIDTTDKANDTPLATTSTSVPPLIEREGQIIDRYKLLEQIGEGGFGTVWMAEQTEPVTRKVALKIIKQGMDTKEVIARFEAERQALAMMDHSNIARVLDAGATDTGRPFFVMELVDGLPVTQFCNEQQLDTRQRLQLFRKICEAVNHAHQKGVIHRDIKPSNVMVTLHGDQPVPKVIDFGIAKAVEGKLTDETLFTRFNQFIGTPVYMSPEQAALSGLDIDTRSDIYSLGILLYELLTGKPPFDSKSLLGAGYDEMRRIIREDEPPIPSLRISTVSGEDRTHLTTSHGTDFGKLSRYIKGDLDWIVMRAIEKDRDRRYETANGLAADVQRFLANETVTASPPSVSYRVKKFARRNKAKLATGAVLVLALLVGSAASLWQAFRATEEAKRATTAESLAAVRLVTAQNALAQSEKLTIENREQLIRMHTARGVEQINNGEPALALPWFIKALDLGQTATNRQDLQRIRIAHILSQIPQIYRSWTKPGFATDVKFSANGNYIFAIGAILGGKGRTDGGVSVWHVPTGKPVELSESTDSILHAAFSPNDDRFATISSAGEICLWDLANDLPPIKFEARHPEGHNVVFSPDGTKLLSYGYNRLAKLWNTRTGGILFSRFEINSGSNLRSADFSSDGKRVSILEYSGLTFTFDTDTGLPSMEPVLGYGQILEIQHSLDGRFFATAGQYAQPASIYIRDSKTGTELLRFEHENSVSSIDISPDSSAIATASLDFDSFVQIKDSVTGGDLTPPLPHEAAVSMVRFSPDSRYLATASWNHEARIWDAKSGMPVGSAMVHSAALQSIDFHPSGRYLLTGCVDGTIRIWALVLEPIPSLTIQPEGGASRIAIDRTGKHLLTANSRGTVQVWNTIEGTPVSSPITAGHADIEADFLPGKNTVITSSGEPAIRLWNTETATADGAPLTPMNLRAASLGSKIKFFANPDGTNLIMLIANEFLSSFLTWNISDGVPLYAPIAGGPTRLFEISPDGKIIALVRGEEQTLGHVLQFVSALTGQQIGKNISVKNFAVTGAFSADASIFTLATEKIPFYNQSDFSTIQSWQVQSGEFFAPPGSWSGNPTLLRHAPSGYRFAVGHDNRLDVFDAQTGLPVTPPMNHAGNITDARFSPDGQFLCSLDGTNLLYIYDAVTGEPLSVPIRHPAKITAARFTPDSRRIVTACSDGLVRFWNLAPGTESIDELTPRGQILSGHKIDDTDALSPLSTHDFERQWLTWLTLNGNGLSTNNLIGILGTSFLFPSTNDLADMVARNRTMPELSTSSAVPTPAGIAADAYSTMKLGVIQVWYGWDEDYARTRERVMVRSSDSVSPADAERFAKLICLRPTKDKRLLQTALDFANYAVEQGKSDSALPWFQLALGMAELRAGQHLAAQKALENAEKTTQITYRPELVLSAAGFYRAISLFQQGKKEEALQTFEETEMIMPIPPIDDKDQTTSGADHDHLIIWLAYKEASSMLMVSKTNMRREPLEILEIHASSEMPVDFNGMSQTAERLLENDNLNGFWNSAEKVADATITMTLSREQPVGRAAIRWKSQEGPGGARAMKYTISTSLDHETWNTVYTHDENSANRAEDDVSFVPRRARFVRIHMTHSSSGHGEPPVAYFSAHWIKFYEKPIKYSTGVTDSKTLLLESIPGKYRHQPMENAWHEGTISSTSLQGATVFEWRNLAGVTWRLIPDLERKLLKTQPGAPYYDEGSRAFELRIRDERVTGFVFDDTWFVRDR